MPVTDEHLEAAKKRKADMMAKESSSNGDSSSPQQGQTAIAGTQQAGVSAAASATIVPSKTPAAASGGSPAKATVVIGPEPIHLLDKPRMKQVYTMNVDQVKALATAMGIEVDSKTKADLVTDISRFNASCDSVKSFDVDDCKFEFENIKKQDFQHQLVEL